MNSPRAFALLALGTVLPAVLGRAATLESYFDFTRYGSITPGAAIVSNVHGRTPAVFKPVGATLNQWGLTIDTEQNAGNTGVLIPASALAAYTEDFTLQVWFITTVEAMPNTMIYGGTTSARIDDSLTGDQALFLGYNIARGNKGQTQFLRPVTANGSRYGMTMEAVAGTGLAVLSAQDYVLTYDSKRRVMNAYLNGLFVGTMNTPGFGGLAALSEGFAIGGVQKSAFNSDVTALVNIRSFMIYSGVLSPEQVVQIHSGGPSVALDALRAAKIEVK